MWKRRKENKTVAENSKKLFQSEDDDMNIVGVVLDRYDL